MGKYGSEKNRILAYFRQHFVLPKTIFEILLQDKIGSSVVSLGDLEIFVLYIITFHTSTSRRAIITKFKSSLGGHLRILTGKKAP